MAYRITRKDDLLKVALKLADAGLQWVAMEAYFGSLAKSEAVKIAWKNRSVKKNLREGVWWLSAIDHDGAIAADRAYRLLLELWPGLKADQLGPIHLYIYYKMFIQNYPSTKMDVNRLYYLIQNLKDRKVIAHQSCARCEKPYVTRVEQCRINCGICEYREKLIADNKKRRKNKMGSLQESV